MVHLNFVLFSVHLIPILATIYCMSSQEHISTEDINDILDKLILQTKANETVLNTNVKESFLPNVDPQTGNDSNIYYFKTYMAPHINYKSSSELLHLTRNSNKSIETFEVGDENSEVDKSEDESFPAMMSRKSFMDIENQKHVVPTIIYEGRDGNYPEYKTGNIDESNLLDDLIKKEIVSDINAIKDNKQISYTQHIQQSQPNQQQRLLRDYPEIIIDHITYDNDEKDKEYKNNLVNIKTTHDVQHVQNFVKGDNKNSIVVNTSKPRSKIRYNIPEEEIEIIDRIPLEHFAPKNYLTPEMKSLIEAIIQKKVLHDTILKHTTESESRKQSILLEKILQKLPDKKQTRTNSKTSYSLHHERLSAPEIETLSRLRASLETLHRNVGHHLTKPYLNHAMYSSQGGSPVLNKWQLHNRLLSRLLHMSRPEALKRTRLVTSLIDRIMSNIDYNQPVYYNLYKK